jgi:hypothetical protein
MPRIRRGGRASALTRKDVTPCPINTYRSTSGCIHLPRPMPWHKKHVKAGTSHGRQPERPTATLTLARWRRPVTMEARRARRERCASRAALTVGPCEASLHSLTWQRTRRKRIPPPHKTPPCALTSPSAYTRFGQILAARLPPQARTHGTCWNHAASGDQRSRSTLAYSPTRDGTGTQIA